MSTKEKPRRYRKSRQTGYYTVRDNAERTSVRFETDNEIVAGWLSPELPLSTLLRKFADAVEGKDVKWFAVSIENITVEKPVEERT